MVHQRNRRIHCGHGFTGSFDVPWSRQILDHWSGSGSPQRNAAFVLLPVSEVWLAKWCKIHKVYIHSHSVFLLIFTNMFIHIQQPNLHSRNIFIHIYLCISYSRLYLLTFTRCLHSHSTSYIHSHSRSKYSFNIFCASVSIKHILVPRAYDPSDLRQESRGSGSNHFEITKEITEFCPSGLTQSSSMAHARNGCSQSLFIPAAGQKDRRLWGRECIKYGLRSTDYGLRTGYKTWTQV